ncbi:MAG: DNA adenine methylase [Chitinophagales bacterium]|nr:DNA adenine methylase [Chitinophagales bacterium]
MIKARPFLKWVGGKSQLLEQFENYYPQELRKGLIDSYVEPFLGGGALFFQLSQRYKITKAYLSDLNKDLVLTYQVIQQRPDELLDFLLTDLLVQQLVLLPIQEYHLLIKNSCNWHIFLKN